MGPDDHLDATLGANDYFQQREQEALDEYEAEEVMRQFSIEELQGPAPEWPDWYGPSSTTAERAEWARRHDERKEFDHQRKALEDEIAAARWLARRGKGPDSSWVQSLDDPRFVAWLSVHQEKVERACGEITGALSEKNYTLLEELGRVLSDAAGRCVVGPLDTEESAS